MKRDKWISCLIGAVLAFALSCSGAACLITAFGFEAVSMGTVLLWCGLCAVVFAICYTLKVPLVSVALLALITGYYWRQGELLDSVQGLIHQLSRIYSMGYGWPVFEGTLEMPLYQDVTVAICCLTTLSGFFVSRTVCGEKRAIFAILFSVIPLAFCLVVTDKVPDALWLFVFLLSLCLLILTQTLRRKAPVQANRLAAIALLPAALLTALLFWVFPKETYQNQDLGQQLAADVKAWFDHLTGADDPGGPVKADGGAVDLTDVGKRTESLRKIMTVTAEKSGTLYLRSCAYDTYYRNNWTNLAVECEKLYWPKQELLRNNGKITVETAGTLDMIVFPYYPDEGTLDEVARGISNYTGKKEYTFTWYQLSKLYSAYENLDYRPPDTLTQLPSTTHYWAQTVLPDILKDANCVYSKAQAIASYVSQSAKYDLQTGKMPSDATDFAQWFIEESDTGYCVHFATAATVLLRSADIPARYVTGYLVNVKAGEETTVYGKNAHAWVEYWLPGVGWVMLEATPAAGLQEQISSGETEPEESEDQQSTEPDSTTPEDKEETPDKPKTTKLWLLLVPVILAVLILGQWRLRVYLRRHRRYRGNINRRILTAWGEITQISRLLEQTPEPALFELAQKAKFSRHEMTRSDLAQFSFHIMQGTDRLKQQPIFKRIYYRLILAIY